MVIPAVGALVRGGWRDGPDAGVFAVYDILPSFALTDFGFRCAR